MACNQVTRSGRRRWFPAALVILMIGVVAWPAPALALPPPMSAAELAAASDLVALVRVLSVTCTGLWHYASGDVPGYAARLRVLRVAKGNAYPFSVLTVTWQEPPPGALGPWAVRYFPGEVLWTYLRRGEDGRTYASTWWNARGPQVVEPPSEALPSRPGEAVNLAFWPAIVAGVSDVLWATILPTRAPDIAGHRER